MADVSKIKLPDNSEVNIKDSRISGVDTTPTSNSTNVVTSGGIFTAINNIPSLPSVTASDNGKVMMVVDASWLASKINIPNYYVGTTPPPLSIGEDGDVYIQISPDFSSLSWTSAEVFAAQSTKAYIDTSNNVWKTSNTYTGVLIKCDFWRGKNIKFTRQNGVTMIRYAFLRSFQGTAITNNMACYFSQESGYTSLINNTSDEILTETVPSDAVYMYVYAKSSTSNVAPAIDWMGTPPIQQVKDLLSSLFTANKTIGSDGTVYTGTNAKAISCTTNTLDASSYARLFSVKVILNNIPDIYDTMTMNIAEYTATGAFHRRQTYTQIPTIFNLSPATTAFHILISGQKNGSDVNISSVPFNGSDVQVVGTQSI